MVDDDLSPDAGDAVSELVIPRPLPHQLEDFEATERFKLLRWGRRAGKSRLDFIAATIGHGPGWDRLEPLFPGILQGWDVCWVGKNNPQTRQIWVEEVKPRFKGRLGCRINEVERSVSVEGAGTLHVRSAEAITTIRGIGALLKGLICDEAAWWPFLEAWRNELRPILMDNEGWAIISSTTNAGSDGELNEMGDKITPSGFNRLCLEVMRGAPGRTAADGWRHSHKTARDNPRISRAEFDATLREYPPDSISLAQEIEAKLVAGGAGVAFPEWSDRVHVVRMEPPPGATWFGGLDWGYHPRPTVVYAIAAFGDRELLYRHERLWRQTTPYRVGFELGEFLKRCPALEWIACDPSTSSRTTGPSIMEELQRGLSDSLGDMAPVCLEAPRGEEQRRSRKLLLHEGLRYEARPAREVYDLADDDPGGEEPVVPPWLGPKIRFHPDCTEAVSSIPQLPRSPKGKEDVDTEAYDDPYDAATYPLTARAQADRTPPEDELKGMTRDHHPGFTKGMQREDPWHAPEPGHGQHYRTGIRYRIRRPDEEE